MKIYLKNKYTIVLIGFIIWMFILDKNYILQYIALYKKNQTLQQKIIILKQVIEEKKNELYNLTNNINYIIKVAREKFFLKQEKEDVFLILNKTNKILSLMMFHAI